MGIHPLDRLCEIYTASYLPILFLHQYYVKQPARVLNRLNESYDQQFLHLFDYLPLYLSVEYPGRLGLWVHIQRMHHQSGI